MTFSHSPFVASLFIALLCVSCSHSPSKRTRGAGQPSASLAGTPGNPSSIEQVITEEDEIEPNSDEAEGRNPEMSMKDDGQIIFRGMKLKNWKFDLPVTVNSRVEFWVDYFCGRGRKHFDKYLERSEYYIPYMRPILKQNNMPQDLVYLSMIESGFNNLARSRAKAVGPWQFMSFTGQRYGLRVNWWVDERRDIRKSTLSAIQYLRELYNMFGSWELAAAGYNAGEAKVARAIQRYGTKDFWAIARQKYLKPETRDYVPKLMAAAIIDKNREQFGFPDSGYYPHLANSGEAIAPSGEVVKVIRSAAPNREEVPEDAREIEMAKTQKKIEGGAHEDLVNSDNDDGDEDSLEIDASARVNTKTANPAKVVSRPLTPMMTKSGEVGGEELVEFEIESPADVLDIAKAAGLSYQTVKSLNPELSRWVTPPHSPTYIIKLPKSVKDSFLREYNDPAFVRQVQFLSYTARSGDTLSRIASRFGLKVEPIVDLNRISPRAQMRKGMKIFLPIPSDRKRSLASLGVQDPPEKRKHHTTSRSNRTNPSQNSGHRRMSARDRNAAKSRIRTGI